MVRLGFDEFFTQLTMSCKSDGTFSALLRMEKIEEFIRILESKYRVAAKVKTLLIRFDVNGVPLTFMYPNRVVFKLGPGKDKKDAREFLEKIVSAR